MRKRKTVIAPDVTFETSIQQGYGHYFYPDGWRGDSQAYVSYQYPFTEDTHAEQHAGGSSFPQEGGSSSFHQSGGSPSF